MKLKSSNIGLEFMTDDFEILQQHAKQSLDDLGGPRYAHTIEDIEKFLASLNRLFPDSAYSRTALLEHAATEAEAGYAQALQRTFDLIDTTGPSLDTGTGYNYRRFSILFAMAYKFSLYEDGAVDNKPGFFFVMRVAENVNNGGGSYVGYVARMINYVSSQILEHQELLKAQAAINQNNRKPKAVLSM